MTRTFVSVIALLAATPALAQSNPDQPTVNDKGETIVVTASRSGDAVPVNQLGASVTVLDAQALETRQTRIVSDILRDVPGVAVNTGGLGGLTQIRIRGTESNHVLVLIDGIKASDPYQGEFDFGTLIADSDAKVEVLRGQQSSLYGSDAIGGVIQYITLTGREAPGFSARVEGGSFGTYSGTARVAGVTGNLDYAISGSYYNTDGSPASEYGTVDVGSERVGVSGKFIWSPTDTFKLTAVGRYSHTEADLAGFGADPLHSPPAPNPAVPGDDLLQIALDAPGSYFTNEAFYGLLRAELVSLDGRWTNVLSGQIADTTRDGYTANIRDSGDHGQRLKGSFESSLRLGDDEISHRITGAVDFERETFRNSSPASPFFASFSGERQTDNIGFVGQYELTVKDRLSLGASVRHDENDRFADPTTFRVQGSYRLPTGTRIRAAYGTGVKNPGYFELYGFDDGQYIGNPGLKPEKSEGWEAGVEQQLGRDATFGATWFDSRLTNEIAAIGFPSTPVNLATRSKQHGVEVFLAARPIAQLRVDANYTYLKSSQDEVAEARRPKHLGSVNVTAFSNDERFSSTLTLRYNGAQVDTAFSSIFFRGIRVNLSDYVLVNLNAQYKLTPNVSVFGRVENLTNERYQEVFGYATTGRAGYGGVSVRF
ncbi:MAG: TonB-dependent receptor [Sphingobium sp.]